MKRGRGFVIEVFSDVLRQIFINLGGDSTARCNYDLWSRLRPRVFRTTITAILCEQKGNEKGELTNPQNLNRFQNCAIPYGLQ